MRIFGLILAGGEGRRMGGADKALLVLGGQTLVDRVAARLAPQVEALALSANGDPARFSHFRGPVLPDADAVRLGPMAGVLAGLDWLADLGGDALVSVSVDTPLVPEGLVAGLRAAAEAAEGFAIAESGGRTHPTCALWPLRLRPALRDALAAGERRIGRWTEAEHAAIAHFGGVPDPFFNINTPDDLERAEAALRA